MDAKLVRFQGKQITFELAETPDLSKVLEKAQGQPTAEINFLDDRRITHKQRGLIFGLFADIGEYTGYPLDYVEMLLKTYHKLLHGLDDFSLKTIACSIEMANCFIETIIQFCFDNDIPFQNREYHIDSDSNKLLFMYTMNRCCCVCGKPHSDIHHVNAIGMGRNRRNIDHTQHWFLSLCRSHHTEAHILGVDSFLEKYHLVPVKLNREQLKEIGVIGGDKK